MVRAPLLSIVAVLSGACGANPEPAPAASGGTIAFIGATLVDGTGAAAIPGAALLVRDGRVVASGSQGSVPIPSNAERVDVRGRTIVPGLINSHGHVGNVRGLETAAQHYTRENILDQLARYARYGVTTVVSLGDDGPEGVRLRDEQNTPTLNRARLFVAGPVLAPARPEDAAGDVASIAELRADWAKIRVDDGLGQREKMPPPVYEAVIREAHRHGLPLAAHIVGLEDAKGVIRAGADLIAHSVRDAPVDAELIALMRERDVCLTPTLTRELSTFVYGSRPDFFDDPFFLKEADPRVLEQLQDPERQRRTRESPSARHFQRALPIALRNLKALADAGVGIAFGTDSGVAARFQGYFEHLEMELMDEAGLSPMQILRSATGDAARCTGLDDDLGTLELGKWADFIVLQRDPTTDIRNMRTIESVWIAGNRVPDARP